MYNPNTSLGIFYALFSTVICAPAVAEPINDQFTIEVSNGIVIDQASARVVVRYVESDSWRIETRYETFSIEVYFGASSDTESLEVNDRNNFLSFWIPSTKGTNIQVFCKPDRISPGGWMKRTELTEEHVTGTFELVLTECTDMGDTPIEYAELPLTVTGSFSLEKVGILEGIKRRPKSD